MRRTDTSKSKAHVTGSALGIGELIRSVHRELLESRRARIAKGLAPFFQVQGLTVEVHFVVTQSDKARAGFDLKVVTAGADRAYEESQVHKIRLDLRVAESVTEATLNENLALSA